MASGLPGVSCTLVRCRHGRHGSPLHRQGSWPVSNEGPSADAAGRVQLAVGAVGSQQRCWDWQTDHVPVPIHVRCVVVRRACAWVGREDAMWDACEV